MLLDQLLTNPRLKMIGCCNELNAGYAADGYARSNGVAAFVVTYSVGGLSALNAVACAYAEDLPVLVIVGGINSDSGRQDRLIHHALGEVRYDYQRKIYAEVTAGAFAVEHAADAPGTIDRAIDLALRRRKPVMLEIACNLAPLAVPPPRPRSGSTRRRSATPPRWPTPWRTPPSCSTPPAAGAGGGLEAPPPRRRARRSSRWPTPRATPWPSVPAARGCSRRPTRDSSASTGAPSAGRASPRSWSRPTRTCFAGTLLSDYATTGFTTALDPKRMVLAMPEEIRLPGATYADVALADFLAALAAKVRRNDASLREFRGRTSSPPPRPPAAPDARLRIEEVARQVRAALGAGTALLVETGDSWFHGLETRLPEGCRFEIQFQAGSIGWSVPATLGYELGFRSPGG